MNSPFLIHPIVDSTSILSPTVSLVRIDLVNFVLVAVENSPFTLASLSTISYKSSPSYLPSYMTLSTMAEAYVPLVWVIFLPIRSVTVPDNTLTLSE